MATAVIIICSHMAKLLLPPSQVVTELRFHCPFPHQFLAFFLVFYVTGTLCQAI